MAILINRSSVLLNIKRVSLGFGRNNRIMSLHLCGKEIIFKRMYKAANQSHFLLWQLSALSWNCTHSSNLRMSFFFKNLSSASLHPMFELQIFEITKNVSLGLLVMQTLYINNVFSVFIQQYFIDTLKIILKIFQGFRITLLKKYFHCVFGFGLIFR